MKTKFTIGAGVRRVSEALTIKSVTIDSTGEVYTLSDDTTAVAAELSAVPKARKRRINGAPIRKPKRAQTVAAAELQ